MTIGQALTPFFWQASPLSLTTQSQSHPTALALATPTRGVRHIAVSACWEVCPKMTKRVTLIDYLAVSQSNRYVQTFGTVREAEPSPT